tara:strand:+ start:53 stop:697 length:645 start_codon:yes stop_codon:yes gene_type:complete
MIKTILFSVYFFISSIIFVSAQQLKYDETYNTEIKDAYGLLDVPLPPGEWKLFDLEEVGSVSSGDFFVYASLMPANISDQERRYNDTLAVNLFGSSSEETDYRKSYFICQQDWMAGADIIKIEKNPDGTFMEKCGVNFADPTVNVGQVFGGQGMSYHYTSCADSCIELWYNLDSANYKHDKDNFIELGNKIFASVESAIAGDPSSLSFTSDYKN